MKKRIIVASVILIAGVITAAVWFQPEEPLWENKSMKPSTEKEPAREAEPEQRTPVVQAEHTPGAKVEKKDELAIITDICRQKYGHLLSEPKAQIAMLNKLMAYFMKKYPENWQKRMEAFINTTFPEYATRLMSAMARLTAYNSWLAESSHQLSGMSRKEKRELMWQRRREFFGDDAEKIWEAQLKSQSIYQALDDLNSGDFKSYDEKIGHFVDSISNAYGEHSERFIEKRRQELLDVFLENESVQKDLSVMEAEERKEALRKFRLEMGVDEEAIARLEALDVTRDSRWENGLEYMKKRDALTEKYKGEELTKRLDALRTDHFGANADAIKGEESAGVFRFKVPRVFGKIKDACDRFAMNHSTNVVNVHPKYIDNLM